jgi:hypothetical protein
MSAVRETLIAKYAIRASEHPEGVELPTELADALLAHQALGHAFRVVHDVARGVYVYSVYDREWEEPSMASLLRDVTRGR